MQSGRYFLLVISLCGAAVLSSCEKPEDKAVALLEKENFSMTPADFVRAAAMGDQVAVTNFLTAGMDIDARNPEGESAIIAAATRGHTQIVELLVKQEASIDVRGNEGRTPLMTASSNNYAEIVRLLIDSGADTNKKDNSGWTALMQAVYDGHLEIVDLLVTKSNEGGDRALLVAAMMGHGDVMAVLIENGANINAVTESGETALMMAAQKGRVEAVRFLLSKGADKSLKNHVGETADRLATDRGHAELAKLIADAPVVAAAPNLPPPHVSTAEPGTSLTSVTESPTRAVAESAPPAANPVVAQATARPAVPQAPVTTAPTNPAAMGEIVAVAPAATTNRNPARMGLIAEPALPSESPEEEWFDKHKLDLNDSTMLDQDPDSDEFSNREEFLADTDPHSAASRPSLVTRLVMVGYSQEELPLVLESVNGGSAQVRNTSTGEVMTLRKGDTISGMPYAVASVRSRIISSKEAQRADVSEVTLKNSRSGQSVLLVRGMRAKAANAAASLQFPSGETVQVKLNESFSVPGEASTQYTAIDIRPTQTIVRNAESGATFTIPKAAGSR